MKKRTTIIFPLFVLVFLMASFLLTWRFSRGRKIVSLPQVMAQASSSDWPTRAGTMNRSAFVSTDLPLDSTPGYPYPGSDYTNRPHLNLKWKRFLGERIEVEMEPTVVGDTVFIGLMNGKLYALNKETGETRWVFQAGGPVSDTPTIALVNNQLRIFFGSHDGKIYALDALAGSLVWSYQTAGPIMSTPGFYQDTVFIGSLDKKFYGLDAVSGHLKWSYQTSGPISCTSALADLGNGSFGIFFSSGDNVAYGLNTNGNLLWQKQMNGVFTKRTYAVFGQGANGKRVVMFVTRKAGWEYSEPHENLPSVLQGSSQPGDIVVNAWADYYIQYPKRRTLYYFDALNGQDLWQPQIDKTKYTPLYIPYWGEYSPVLDNQGNAWLPAGGSGGDHGLGHDIRLWRINLDSGEYIHEAYSDELGLRGDEVGRVTLVNNRYYQTISEDIGYFEISSKTINQEVFSNGFHSHRYPLELDEFLNNQETIFGGMYKHFGRFASSGPGAFGGGNDAPSPLIVAGNQAFFTTWGHIYALSSEKVVSTKNYANFDPVSPMATNLNKPIVKQMISENIQKIVDDNVHLNPVSRMWSWAGWNPGVFWHDGEVVKTLSEALDYVDEPLKTRLKNYLKNEVTSYIFNPKRYEYRYGTNGNPPCVNFDTGQFEDSCQNQGISASWQWNNPNLIAERIYALYKYAQKTDDWSTITQNWNFILNTMYNGMQRNSWDQEAGFFLWPDWISGDFYPHLQMGAIYAMREIATKVGNQTIINETNSYLNRMMERRTYWGNYVRSLYDSGSLAREEFDHPYDWGYDQTVSPIPPEGYLDRSNDFRHPFYIERTTSGLNIKIQSYPCGLRVGGHAYDCNFPQAYNIYPYYFVGYHPFYSEFNDLVRQNLQDQVRDHIAALEVMNPWWYMGDYGHQVSIGIHEEDSFSIIAAADMFQAKAYILQESFEKLAPYLPWTFENYDYKDIYRMQNMVALMQAPEEQVILRGDIDRDGDVDWDDAFLVMRNWWGSGVGDVDGNGKVNSIDLVWVIRDWRK